MQTVTNNAFVKIAAAVAGLAMVASMAFAFVPLAQAQTTAQLQAEISTLLAQIQSLQTQLSGVSSSGSTVSNTSGSTSQCSFTKSLTIGSRGAAVTCLQNYLTTGGYFTYSGGSTGYFGPVTRKAVAAWQAANGVAPAVGYFGPISQAKYASLTAAVASTGNTGSTGTTGSTGSTGTTLTGNGLQVSLSSNSPNGKVLVAGQGIGNLAEFTFSNPTSAPINVTSLSFKRIGVSNDSTMTNVYLYNGMQRITDSAGVSNSKFTFNNSAGLFTVPAGSTYTVTVRSDILTGTSGQQLGVELTSPVGSNGTLDSSVSFPIKGGLQAISAANLATVDFTGTTLPSTNGSLSPTADYTVWQNTVSVTGNPVNLSTMTFTNLGSINANNIQNLRLYVDGTQVGSAVSQLSANRTVTFDLSANPVLLSTANHIIKVIANVTGGSGRTFDLSLQRSSDAMFIDSDLGQPVTPISNGSPTSFSAVTSGQQMVASVSGTSGVSVTRAAASPTNDIPYGATNVKLASFNFLATGEAVKVRDLYVFASTTSDGSTVVNTNNLANGKIMVNGVQIGSTKTILNGAGTGQSTNFSLGSSLIIPAGTVTTVDIYADAKTASSGSIPSVNIPSTGTIRVSLKAAASNGQGQSSLNAVDIPASNDVPANSITVSNSALTASKFSGYGDQTMIPGTQNARLGSFTLSAGSTEGINVNTIALDLNGGAGVTNLTLKDHATGAQIGSIITTPSGTTANNFSTNFTIPESGTKTIDVYGNLLTTAASSVQAILTNGTSGTGSVTSTSASLSGNVTLQNMTVGSGTLAVALSASNPVNANVLAGSNQAEVADYTFSAQNSPYTVKKLEITIPSNEATSTTGVTLQYNDANGVQHSITSAVTTSATANVGTTTFSGLSFYVPENDSADVKVFVGIPTIANGATSGAAITTTLKYAVGFQAIDSAGNATSSVGLADVASNATGGYGTVYVRKSFPTFAMQSLTGSPAAGSAIYRVNVTADPAGAVDLDQMTFKVATTTATVSGFTLYDVTGGTATALNTSAVQATSAGVVKISFANLQQVGAGQTKTYELRPAVLSGWQTGASITVSLMQDTSAVANADAATINASSNTTWSDRSASDHATLGTAAADWTNGYLLKDFVSDVTSFNY